MRLSPSERWSCCTYLMLQCDTIIFSASYQRKDIMAAKVTLLIFWYFLLLINVLHADETESVLQPDQGSASNIPSGGSIKASLTTTTITQATTSAQTTTAASTPKDNPNSTTTTMPNAASTSAASQTTKQQNQTSPPQATTSVTDSGNTSTPTTTTAVKFSTTAGTTSPTVEITTTNRTSGNSKNVENTSPQNETSPINNENADSQSDKSALNIDTRYFWLLLLLGAVVVVLIYAKLKCFKVEHPVETMDHGTENASFQRTESNKDGVMLLGVKSGGEENAK